MVVTDKLLEKVLALRASGLREFPCLTEEQSKINPFDSKKNHYSYLARTTMLVIPPSEMEKLEDIGVIFTDGKSSVYGDHTVMILSGIN